MLRRAITAFNAVVLCITTTTTVKLLTVTQIARLAADGASSGPSRVCRGGSWGHEADYAHVCLRVRGLQDSRREFCGFRVVRSSSN